MLLWMAEKAGEAQASGRSADGGATRERLLDAATLLIRRQGYTATSVEEICAEAGVSKGAFFHHFKGKEALAEAALERWTAQTTGMLAGLFQAEQPSPVQRLTSVLDFFVELFSQPGTLKSCLVGTTVQEVAGSHPRLCEAAQRSFAQHGAGLTQLLEEAAASRGRQLDCPGLARLWLGTIQGSLILAKASGDDSVVAASLRHVRSYILGLLLLKGVAGTGGAHES